jgi:hypothetical protein
VHKKGGQAKDKLSAAYYGRPLNRNPLIAIKMLITNEFSGVD